MTAYADIGGPFPLNDSELMLSRAETHHILLKTILFVVRQISQELCKHKVQSSLRLPYSM